MNWIKDNLIMVLGGLVVVLSLALIIEELRHKMRYARLETAASTNATNYANAKEANASAVTVINELTAANAAIVAQMTIDTADAAAAAERVTALNEQLAQKSAENTLFRRKLAQENPDVAKHLRIGVPCDVARSLWPEASYCSPADR